LEEREGGSPDAVEEGQVHRVQFQSELGGISRGGRSGEKYPGVNGVNTDCARGERSLPSNDPSYGKGTRQERRARGGVSGLDGQTVGRGQDWKARSGMKENLWASIWRDSGSIGGSRARRLGNISGN